MGLMRSHLRTTVGRLNRALDLDVVRADMTKPLPSFVFLMIYRQKSSATAQELVEEALSLGGQPVLWALDIEVPALSRWTVGQGPGRKFELLDAMLENLVLADETFVVVSDDDYAWVRRDLQTCLRLGLELDLDLWQPAHLDHENVSHRFTVRRPRTLARIGNFVEIGPVFLMSPAARRSLIPFSVEGMGWGLETTWGGLSLSGQLRLAVVDATCIRHLAAPASTYDWRANHAELDRAVARTGLTVADLQAVSLRVPRSAKRPAVAAVGRHALPDLALDLPVTAADVTVVIVTYEREAFLQPLLESLTGYASATTVVVVDASSGDKSQTLTANFPQATYFRFRGGAGHMTRARNVGLAQVRTRIVAFLDDDVTVSPGWAAAVVSAFATGVAAVAGRTINPGYEIAEEAQAGRVGVLGSNGKLVANFDADGDDLIPVHHGIGANMSFRTEALLSIGGLRDDFRGTEMREDTDIFLRVLHSGGRVVFAPKALVHHAGAPHVKGQRFDVRYKYFAARNHVKLLGRIYGIRSDIVRQYWRSALVETAHAPGSFRGRTRNTALAAAGLAVGTGDRLIRERLRPEDPVRREDTLGAVLSSRVQPADT